MHICVGKLTIIGSDNGLSPERRQAIIWTNTGILLIEPLGRNFSEILIKIQTFSLKKIRLKMLSAKCSFRPGLNMLRVCEDRNVMNCNTAMTEHWMRKTHFFGKFILKKSHHIKLFDSEIGYIVYITCIQKLILSIIQNTWYKYCYHTKLGGILNNLTMRTPRGYITLMSKYPNAGI